ncbi:metal-dependent hydrolase [Loktanella sp. SALINAS62]|uniref:metal-dependent hydrolase n=1 Tax=Loktanella sp. SALINAS62 TaxID=2706124 RepID=UPI001B8C61AB|nr:metal-dependent hydrolase [Loktanella sp. SALINAS62]MBS1303174.1 metal-dependent hydrolase [Loktanella sp. SALINAS62]
MKIIWLGHASFRIEIGDAVLLIDPWLAENPSFPDDQRDAALQGVTHILLTHGHVDHASEVPQIARDTGASIYTMVELASLLEADGVTTVGFNKGGTVDLKGVRATMVNAVHSSSFATADGARYAGTECGYMIEGDGRTIYFSGDTDIMADMDWMGDLHRPDIGILCAGGHYTMDMSRAAYAAKRYFNFTTLIPCHYGTFDALDQDASVMRDALPDVDVLTPAVMETVTL